MGGEKESIPLVLVAIQNLIKSHCPDCLNSIIQEKDKAVIYSKPTTAAKYAIRGYIESVLKIPFENVSGKYYFYIQIDDLLKNDVIKEKIRDLMSAKLPESTVDFTSRLLNLNEKIQIAAILNLFVAPQDKRKWGAKSEMVYYEGPSIKFRGHHVSKQLKESLALSDIAIAIGFTPEMLQKLRAMIMDESHASIHYYMIQDDSVLRPLLKIIKAMEQETKLYIQNSGDIEDVTTQMEMLVLTYHQQQRMTKLTEALPGMSAVIKHIEGYASFFKPEEKMSNTFKSDAELEAAKLKS